MDDATKGANGQMGMGAIQTTRSKGHGVRRVSKSKPAPTKRPLKLSLDTETIEKLTIHAIRHTGGNLSAMVVKLVADHCNEWVIHRTPRPE